MTFAYILQFYSTSKCESSQTSGCLQDLYGLIDKPADVVWQDDRCKRKQPQQSQSPASVRSFLARKWLFKNGDVLDRTYARFQTGVQLHSHKWSSKKEHGQNLREISNLIWEGGFTSHGKKVKQKPKESQAAMPPFERNWSPCINVSVNSWVLQSHYLGSISMHVTSEAPNLVLFEWYW